MRNFLLISQLLLSVSLFAQEKIENPHLKLLIDSLYEIDQRVQTDAVEAFQRTGSMDSFQVYEKLEFAAFARHNPVLKRIVKEHGYPNFEKVGKETSSSFFTMIQHADVDVAFQSEMLMLLREQVQKKQVKGSNYALLYDRVQINSGKKQLYGSQVDYDTSGNAFSKPMADEANVNARRAEFGMSPIEEYLKQMTELHKKQNQQK